MTAYAFQPGRNTIRFLYCILLSAFMWLFTAMNREHEYKISVDVDYTYPGNKVNKSILPDHVDLTVQATGWKLLRALSLKHNVLLDMGDASERSVFLTNENTILFTNKLPSGIQVKTVAPDTILFDYDEKIEKKVPVVLHSDLQIKKGYDIVNKVEFNPDSITITGPRSIVENYTEWKTEAIKKSNIDNNIQGTIPLMRDEKNNIRVSAVAVQYKIEVQEFVDYEIKIPVTAKPAGTNQQFKIVPDSVNVSVSLPKSYADSIDFLNIFVQADLSDTTVAKPVKINVSVQPPGKVKDYEPKEVQFILQE